MFKDILPIMQSFADGVDALIATLNQTKDELNKTYNVDGAIYVDKLKNANNVFQTSKDELIAKTKEQVDAVVVALKEQAQQNIDFSGSADAIADVELLKMSRIVTQSDFDAVFARHLKNPLAIKVLKEYAISKGLKYDVLHTMTDFMDIADAISNYCMNFANRYDGKRNYLQTLFLKNGTIQMHGDVENLSDLDDAFAKAIKN